MRGKILQTKLIEGHYSSKFPNVFQGLGKLQGYQLKLHIDENVQPVAQPVHRIPFSTRAKVTEKLEELLTLDVIEKVEGPTSWVNPLVVVEKPNGDIRIRLDMRQIRPLYGRNTQYQQLKRHFKRSSMPKFSSS